MALGFLITRIVGYSLMAAWLFRCGPDIEELLLPVHLRDEMGEEMLKFPITKRRGCASFC